MEKTTRHVAADGKQPHSDGIKVCAEVMVKMLEIGWQKSDLDELERVFWTVRDHRGNVYKPENNESNN